MKRSIKSTALAIVAVITMQTAFAQKSEWMELKTFHSVMSKTFHPAEEGNLQPVKENAADLLAKAKAWHESAVPAGFKKDETKEVLVNLVAKCEEIVSAVKAERSDDDLNQLIVEAHEIFHQIVEKCRNHEKEE